MFSTAPGAPYTQSMWLLALIAVLILAASLYADWRWRRWMALRRQQRDHDQGSGQ